mgnify:FL=1
MNRKGTDEVIDQVFNADRWTALAGLQDARPEPQEFTALDEVATVTGHAWEVRIERPAASIAYETNTGSNAILLVTSGRSLDEVSHAFSEKGITQLVRGVEYLGPVSGRANVTDEKLLLRLIKLNTIERLDRASLQSQVQTHMTVAEREAHKAELRKKLEDSGKFIPESIRHALEPDLRDDPFKVAEELDRTAVVQSKVAIAQDPSESDDARAQAAGELASMLCVRQEELDDDYSGGDLK